MYVVNQVIDPRATSVLIGAHAPEGSHLGSWVTVQGCQVFDVFGRYPGVLFYFFGTVIRQHFLERIERHVLWLVSKFKIIFQAVTNVGFS